MDAANRFLTYHLPLLALLGIALGCAENESHEEAGAEPQTAAGVGVRLSKEAVEGMGIVTSPVESRPVRPALKRTGWLTARPTNETTIRAAATGYLTTAPDDATIDVGSQVNAGQRIAAIRPLLSPAEEAQLVAMKEEADILIRQSKATLDAAAARLQRVEELGKSGPIAGKDVEQAKETVQRARAAYEEAQEQLPFLPAEPYTRPLQTGAIEIDSPQGGRVLEAFVRPGQFVLQGDALWTVADWSVLWLRVPVFEGDLPQIDKAAAIEVVVPGEEVSRSATPFDLPLPTRDGLRTVDLLYEIANTDGSLRRGQPIPVALPTAQAGPRLVVPRSAVLWDGTGGTFVYVEDAAGVFRRQRIRLGVSVDDEIVVEDGLRKGQNVVTVGAETLYGEEFKDQMQAPEDDD